MDAIPAEILPIVVGHLPPSDAIHLNNTCKMLHSKLSLTATTRRTILSKFLGRARDGDAHYGFLIPVPHQVRCHSMLVSIIWKHRGLDNNKGKLFVVAEEKVCLRRRRVVYTSPVVLQEEQTLHITFQPKGHETYHLWYVGGGSGKHSLSLHSVTIQALVYDDLSRCFGNAHNFATRSKAIAAWDDISGMIIHLDIEQFLLTHEEHLLSQLVTFAGGRDVSKEDSRQKLVGYIISLWQSSMKEYKYFAYTQCMADARFRARGLHR